ncbi:hypothetical protein PYCC9005_005482 [Savitreella phatthalungensis]
MTQDRLALPDRASAGDSSSSDARTQTQTQTQTLTVDGERISLDVLGPMVINSDGSVSRIANWHDLTEAEQARILRVIARRNAARRQALERLSDGEAPSA